MKGNHVKAVWVGFSDDKPHRTTVGTDADYCVCSTRARASSMYEDVRKAWLVWPVTPKRRKRRARNGNSKP